MSDQHTTGPAALVVAATVGRYYLEGATKVEIAAELGLSRFKVARLLDEARATGIVRIELDSPGHLDLDLSVRLGEAYGLRHCIVMEVPEDDEELLRASLGRSAAELVSEIVEPGDVLGLAHNAGDRRPRRTWLRIALRCWAQAPTMRVRSVANWPYARAHGPSPDHSDGASCAATRESGSLG